MPHFPIPSVPKDDAIKPAQLKNPHQIKGKITPAPVDGQLSLTGVFATSLLKRDFNLETTAIIQSGKLGLTFRQLDEMSRRVARILGTKISFISSSSDGKEAPCNLNGDSIIVLVSDGTLIDERTVVLILAILKLGATYLNIRLGKLESHSDWEWIIREVQPLLVIMTDTATVPEMIRKTYVSCSVVGGSGKTKLPHSTWTSQDLWDEALKLPFAESNDITISPLRTRKPPGERPVGIFPFIAVPFRKTRLVYIGHRVILNRIYWEKSQFSPSDKEKLYLTYPISDPRSLSQIFMALFMGRSLNILDPGILIDPRVLMNEVKHWAINRIHLTPQQLNGLLDYIKEFGNKKHMSTIRYWIISGSNGGYFSYELATKFFSTFPIEGHKSTLVVLYGIPEVLWAAAYYTCSSIKDIGKLQDYGGIYLGWPIHNTFIHIVDDKSYTDCAFGVKGEICINGGGLGDGGFAGSVSKFKSAADVYPTGDLGRIVNDKNGNRILVYEGSVLSRVKIGRKVVDLKNTANILVAKGYVEQCILFTSPRARNSQRIVAAYVPHSAENTDRIYPNHILHEKFKEIESSISAIIELDASTGIPTCEDGKVNYKELRRLYHYHLTSCDPPEWESLDVDPENLEFAKALCRAVAASIGSKLSTVMEYYNGQKPFWKISGNATAALRCIEAVKSQKYNLAVEDFVAAPRLDQLVDRMVAYKRHRGIWKKSIEEIRRKLNFYDLTSKYWKDVTTLLKRDYEFRIAGQNMPGLPRFWRLVMEELVLQSMCSVATIQGKVVGVTLSFKSPINLQAAPPLIQATMQMMQEQIDNCRPLMPLNVKAAQSFYIAIDKEYPTYAQRIMIARDLLIRNHEACQRAGLGGFILCTADPLVQEVATLLLRYNTLSEIPVNRYKTGSFSKPFWDSEDDVRVGVYFKEIPLSPHELSNKNLRNSLSNKPAAARSKSKSKTGVAGKSRSKSLTKNASSKIN